MDQRVTFSGIDSEVEYELPINPVFIDMHDNPSTVTVECYGSETAVQTIFDNRVYEMTWRGWSATHVVFSGMLSNLKDYENDEVYINFGDITPLFINTATTGWNGPYRVKEVQPVVRAGASMVFESVTLRFYKTT